MNNQQYYKTFTYPGVFEIVKNPVNNLPIVTKKTNRYKVPDKIYGRLKFYIDYYWRSFKDNNYKGGVLLTGQKGSGKTLIATSIANNAIDAGMMVVEVFNVRYSKELLTLLDSLDNVVYLLDEFGKNFNINQQESMLTLLSNLEDKQRIVIITENNKVSISPFIRNRPGRVRYSMDFNKLPMDVITEYCKDMNVEYTFINKLLDIYKETLVFQFDHLKAIVEEHIRYPDIKFEDIIDLLNLDMLSGTSTLTLYKILKDNKEVDFEIREIYPYKITLHYLENNPRFYIDLAFNKIDIDINKKPDNNELKGLNLQLNALKITLTKDDLKYSTDEEVCFEKNDVTYIFKIVKK